MNQIEILKALHDKATPGRFINNPHYECVHTHSELGKLRPVLRYSHNNPNAENDSELFVAMRNALPDLLAAVEAAQARQDLADTFTCVADPVGVGRPRHELWDRLEQLDGNLRAALSRLTTTSADTCSLYLAPGGFQCDKCGKVYANADGERPRCSRKHSGANHG